MKAEVSTVAITDKSRFHCKFVLPLPALVPLTLIFLLTSCGAGQPEAQVTASITSGPAPLSVTFTNDSKNSDEFQWDFGDGATTTSTDTAVAVTHQYTKAGTHTVTLTAIRDGEPPQTSTAILTVTVDPALGGSRDIPFSEVVSMATRGDVELIEVNGDKLTVNSSGGDVFTSRKETGTSVLETLERAGVDRATSNIQIIVMSAKGERLVSIGAKGEHIRFADFERLSEGQKRIVQRVGTAEFDRRQSLAEGIREQQQAEHRAEQEAERR